MSIKFLPSGALIAGKYRIAHPVGRGGFCTVYQAIHEAMERTVAIKLFDPSDVQEDDLARRANKERFEQQARLISKLKHPNTVTLFDFGFEPDGRAYLVMEYVEGATLHELLSQDGSLSVDRVVDLFIQILGSLEEAHNQGIIHSDLKPDNIMVTENFKGEPLAKVLDFGIAQILKAPRPQDDPQTSDFVGTPRYAAPEQLARGPLSLATDIYSAGALMWACLTGTPMVPKGTFQDYLRHATSTRPWKLPQALDAPPALVAIVERAVRKSKEDRFRDAGEMLAALRDVDLMSPKPPTDGPMQRRPAEVVDPNLEGENFFTNPDFEETTTKSTGVKPPSPSTGPPIKAQPPALPNDSESANVASSLEDELLASPLEDEPELELDTPQADPSPAEDRGDPPRPIAHRRAPLRSPSKAPNYLLWAGLAGFCLLMLTGLVILLAVVLIGSDSEPGSEADADEDSSPLAQFELPSAPDEPATQQPPRRSPHSVDGVLMGLRTDGWRIDAYRDPVELQQYRFRPVTAHTIDHRLDLTIYEVYGDPDTLHTLQNQVTYPDQVVVMDHIVVRIRPRTDNDIDSAVEARLALEKFRDLVAQEPRR